MYTIPHHFGGHHHLKQVPQEAIDACKEECLQRGPCTCDETVFDLCCIAMEENFLTPPTTANECIELYLYLRIYIHQNMSNTA